MPTGRAELMSRRIPKEIKEEILSEGRYLMVLERRARALR
jgi:hypothetical protein